MPPARKGGRGQGGKQAYAGSGKRGSQGGRATNVIDLTGGGVSTSMFGLPQTQAMPFMGMGLGMPMTTLMGANLIGPQTSMCFAPSAMQQGGTEGANAAMQMMQQQLMMAQWAQHFGGGSLLQKNTVQVKMSEADLHMIQMQKMQQQFAMFQAMQDQATRIQHSAQHSGGYESSKDGSDILEDADEAPHASIDKQVCMLDVARHQTKQQEIDKIMDETLHKYISDPEYKDKPEAALEACRAAAKILCARSTPVKQLEEIAIRVAEMVRERDEKARLEADLKEVAPSKDVTHNLLTRLEAVEEKVESKAANKIATPITNSLHAPFNSGLMLPLNMNMGWASSPYHAMAQLQQQQAGLAGLPMESNTPAIGTPVKTPQSSPSQSDLSRYDVVTTGEGADKEWGWMTTRSATLPTSRKQSDEDNDEDGDPKRSGSKFVKGLHPEYEFDIKSLQTWEKALDRGPKPVPVSSKVKIATHIRKRSKAEFMFWRL